MSVVIEVGRKEPKFVCTGCGRCCYGGQGALLLWDEIEAYQKAFPETELMRTTMEPFEKIIAVIPKDEHGGCQHLNEDRRTCSLHGSPLKPRLCDGWPKAPDSQRQDECLGIWFV
jgi:Fe-S-cluster containining protein